MRRRGVVGSLSPAVARMLSCTAWLALLGLPAAHGQEASSRAAGAAGPEDLPILAHGATDGALTGLRSPFDDVEQIPPVSPFAAANDPNASDTGLYVVQSDIEDEAAAAAAANGVVKPNGKPAGTAPAARKATPTRFFVDPSARIAFSKTPMPYLTMSAYATAGSAFFEEYTRPTPVAFNARSGTLNGGVTASANLGFVNAGFTYDHSQPYKDYFTSRRAPGDGVGATLSRTFPFFIPGLVVNPSLSVKRAESNPVTGLTDNAGFNLGFNYKVGKNIDLSVAPTYGWTFNTYLPGYKRSNGYGTTAGVTYKPLDGLLLSVAVSTGYNANYGVVLADKRRNLSANPTVKAQYALTSIVSLAVQAGYAETWSNVKAASSYKYNLVPSVAVSIPL